MSGHFFFGDISPKAIPTLRAEMLRLVTASAPDRAGRAEDRLAAICPWEEGEDTAAPPGLGKIHADIRRRRVIGAAPLAAALSAPVADTVSRALVDGLGGWIVLATLERPLEREPESLVVDAMNAFRLLKGGRPARISLPALAQATTLAGAAEMLRKREVGASHDIANRLRPIRALLDAAATGRGVIERESGTRRGGVKSRPGGAAPGGLDMLIEAFDATSFPDSLDMPAATAEADAPEPVRQVIRTGRSYDDAARDRSRTRAIAASAAMRDLALPASPEVLTRHEALALVSAARANLGDAALTALVLSLIFGRPVERLCAAFEADAIDVAPEGVTEVPREAWTQGSGRAFVLETAIDLPAFAVDLPKALARKLGSDGRERLRFGVPAPFRANLLLGLDVKRCETALKALRGAVCRPYTRTRIAAWLGAWLRNRGADPAAIGVLTGQDPGTRAQMHYTGFSTGDLMELWETALTEGLGLRPPPRPRSAPVIGARQRMPKDVLRRIFGLLRSEIEADRHSDPPRPIAELAAAHDRFAVYTLELLDFATGHRPVDAPYERFSDLDLEAGLLGIADKAARGGRAERIVALPPAAVTQLRHWIAHVAALQKTLSWRTDPAIVARIGAALEGGPRGAPLFFFLAPEGTIIEPARAEITARRRAVLPVQTNFARQMLRSHLVACGVAGEAIDASFGHARLGEEPWGAFATLSVADLRDVAAAAETLLHELGLTPCPGPLEALK